MLKIGVVGTITQASFEGEIIIALNLAFDEAMDDQPARNVCVSVYDGNWAVARYVIRIAGERDWKWIREGEPAVEAYGMNPQQGDTLDNNWFLECNALVRIGASPASLIAVRRFRSTYTKAYVYEYDFPIFGDPYQNTGCRHPHMVSAASISPYSLQQIYQDDDMGTQCQQFEWLDVSRVSR